MTRYLMPSLGLCALFICTISVIIWTLIVKAIRFLFGLG